MKETDLIEFLQWLPTKVEEFKNKTPEEIASILNELSRTDEGKLQIERLVEEFTSKSKLFKNGGKLDYLVEKLKKGGKKTIDTPNGTIYRDNEGEYKDVDGKNVSYKQGALKEWAAQKAADKFAEQYFRSDSTYHTLPGGSIYTRSTFYPYSTDTIVSKDGKVYTNSLGRSIRKFVTGTSPFDQINRTIDSIAGYTTKRYQEGGEFTYLNGAKKQEIYLKPDANRKVHLAYPEFERYISPDKADTVYVDKIGKIKSGNIDDNLSFLGWNVNKVPYLPWNKDKKIQQIKERKKAIIEKFNKLK